MKTLTAYIGLLVALFTCTSVSAQIPHYANLSGQIDKIDSVKIGDRITINVKTLGNIYSLSLKRVPPLRPNGPVLFKGKVKLHSWEKRFGGASGDIIGNKLTLRFYNRRQNLLMVTKVRNEAVAHTHFISRYLDIQCGQDASNSLVRAAELPLGTIATQVYSPPRFIEISTDADFEFFDHYGNNTNNQIQAFINSAEAIYLEQLGLKFDLIRQHDFTSLNEPYTSNEASDLLNQFQEYATSHDHLGNADVYHLLTGKNINSNIIGVAFTGAVCQDDNLDSFGLSQLVDPAVQPFVMAHEIGHGLGAGHDHVTNSLMSPVVGESTTRFSPFSLEELTSYIDAFGSCLSTELTRRITISSAALTAKVRVKTAQFVATLKSGGPEQNCTVSLYGAVTQAALRPSLNALSIGVDATLLASKIISPSSGVTISAKVKNGTSLKKTNGYIKAQMSCPDGTSATSSIKRLSGYGYGKKAALRKLFSLIKANVALSAG